MRSFIKKIFVLVPVIAVVGGAIFWGWKARSSSKSTFRVVPLKRGDIASTIGASGTIEPEEVVDVGAQVAGLIKGFGTDINGKPVNYGSVVEEGAVLATIDDSVYAADLAVARAQMEQAKASEQSAAANIEQMKAKLTQTAAEWKRSQALFASHLMAETDYDTAQANYEIAKANVSVADAALSQAKAAKVQAQAALEKAQRNLDFCIIKSPIKGVIIDRRVNIGQTVVASLNAPSLFLIAKDLTKMQIWVSVNEADVVRISPGTPVTFACDAFPNRQFEGTVGKVRLNATMTQNVVMYTVEVNAENPDRALLPYLTANVHFMVRKESNVLLVPNAALRWSPPPSAHILASDADSKPADAPASDSGGDAKSKKKNKGGKETRSVVWVQEGESIRPIEVKTGTTDGSNTAVIADGLSEGQNIVVGEMAANAQASTQNPFLPVVTRR